MPLHLTKRFLGRVLYRAGTGLPRMRPLLTRWGLRTRADWFPDETPEVRSRATGERLRLASFSKNYLSFELFWRGLDYYEPLTTALIRMLASPGGLFVDAGANIGFHSLCLAMARPDMQIVSFEPNPKLHALIEANIRANGFKNITAEELALSDRDGIRPFYLNWSDMSASLERTFDSNHIGVVSVAVTTLDDYLARRGESTDRFLLKVDVEGHEPAFFAGAAETIRRCQPDIIAETAVPYPAKTIEHLRRSGYRFRQITDEGLLPCVEPAARVRGPLVFLNCLLTTRSSAELEGISAALREHARRLDLFQSSKRADRRVMERCQGRPLAARASSRPPHPGGLPGPWPGLQMR